MSASHTHLFSGQFEFEWCLNRLGQLYLPVHAFRPGAVTNSIPFCSHKCPRLEDKLYGHGNDSERQSQAPFAFRMERYDQNIFDIKIFHVNILLVWEVVSLL